MLNAKLTATFRPFAFSLSLRAPLFLSATPAFSSLLSALSLYRNSLSTLPLAPVLFRTNGETKKTSWIKSAEWRDREREGRGWTRAHGHHLRLVTVEKNYKWFAPLHLDESQIILHYELPLRKAPPRVRMYTYLYWKTSIVKNNFCPLFLRTRGPLSPALCFF